MKAVMKVCLMTTLGLSMSAPVMAQAPNWSQEGDYYAPNGTIVQQPTPQESKQFQEGDYYAPGKTTAQRATPRQEYLIRHGDYYAPERQ